MNLIRLFSSLRNEEEGQDLIEYSLLLAFVALASVAMFSSSGTSLSTIWSKVDGKLADATAKG